MKPYIAAEKQKAFAETKGFSDYPYFEGDATKRGLAKRAFIGNETLEPEFDQPKLDLLYDALPPDEPGELVSLRKNRLTETILELEANRASGVMSDAEYDLHIGYAEASLKRLLLVEAARYMKYDAGSSEQQIARDSFNRLNVEVYGEMDTATFNAMLAGESKSIDVAIDPSDYNAMNVVTVLQDFYEGKDISTEEPELMSPESLAKLDAFIEKRYEPVLAAVPETPADVYYDAQQSAAIINDAIRASGLSEAGWACEVNPSKTAPSTNTERRRIFLPVTTNRNADELKRLIVHEVEVHARRGTNGSETGLRPLQFGTANYADVEEGLGVILECAVAGDMSNPSFDRARDRYICAGLALGEDGTPRDARSTYEILWRMLAARRIDNGTISDQAIEAAKAGAMTHIENAFRGTPMHAKGVIYRKLKVYWEGLAKNAAFIEANIDDLDAAFDMAMIGKYDHTDPEEAAVVARLIA